MEEYPNHDHDFSIDLDDIEHELEHLSEEDDTSWILHLESALSENCDFATVHKITKGRPVPNVLRPKVWQLALGVVNVPDAMSSFDELYDMPEQNDLRHDCQQCVESLGNDESEKVAIVSDLESVLTCYCKNRPGGGGASSSGRGHYSRGSGWLDLMLPFISLNITRRELYKCFHSLQAKYIPRECTPNGSPFHLFRLLLLYHDPELCSFLDTKKISPDMYSLPWFRSLFTCVCPLTVVLAMWDMYLQQSDPFLCFFLALVILINSKEQIMELKDETKDVMIERLSNFPSALEEDDVPDFCALAQYYANRTPQSFRRDYQGPLFGITLSVGGTEAEVSVAQALCLPVSVDELLQANKIQSETVRYFVVDCRPADHYNAGHLPTAFHLDSTLMLQAPKEFADAVASLLEAKQRAIDQGSVAAGDHLCFMGSGREEEDQYVNMVVANFLQRKQQYVSLARGGYRALHDLLEGQLSEGLSSHITSQCLPCRPSEGGGVEESPGSLAAAAGGMGQLADWAGDLTTASLAFKDKFTSLKTAVTPRLNVVKDQLKEYIVNPNGQFATTDRHVSSEDRVSQNYYRMAPVFSIDGDSDDNDGPSQGLEPRGEREVVSVTTWRRKPDTEATFECSEIRSSGSPSRGASGKTGSSAGPGNLVLHPSVLMVVGGHLFVLRKAPDSPDLAHIVARRRLVDIVKITSKKRQPEIITFKYGTTPPDAESEEDVEITHQDRFFIPDAGEATKVIKRNIIKQIEKEQA